MSTLLYFDTSVHNHNRVAVFNRCKPMRNNDCHSIMLSQQLIECFRKVSGDLFNRKQAAFAPDEALGYYLLACRIQRRGSLIQ